MRLVFFGTPPFAATCLEALIEGPHELAAAVTRPSKPRGRGQKLKEPAVAELAKTHGIEVLAPRSPKEEDFTDEIGALAPDLCVVVAYGRILPAEILKLPSLGCINAHASLLPALRGAAPIERAILEGVEETGVTIMKMNERMDAGDILASRPLRIEKGQNAGELREALAPLAAALLTRAVDDIAALIAAARPQDESLATYAPPLRAEERKIDWEADALAIERRVRAFAPRPGAFTFDGEGRVKVLRARVAESSEGAGTPGTVSPGSAGSIVVACGSGQLEVQRLQPAGRREMQASAYLHGRGGAARQRFHDQGS